MEKNVLLKAAVLWRKTSAKGNDYFVGRWGGVKVLILANNDRQGEDDPTHLLMITEAASPSKPRRRPTPKPERHARTSEGDGGANGPDDGINDLWPS